MPKTIAITPSWYWPAHVPRVVGVPPFGIHELLVDRRARRDPDGVAVLAPDARLTNRELKERVDAAAGAIASGGAADASTLAGSPSAAGLVTLLGALAAGARVHLDPDTPSFVHDGAAGLRDRVLGLRTAGGATAWHSHRSVLAGAVSLPAFLELGAERPFLSTSPLTTWEGLYGASAPLAAGAPLVLSDPGPAALEAIVREGAGWAFTDLESAFHASREAKREVKSARGVLGCLLLSTGGVFDPDQRRRVSRLFECPALTVFGQAETGPIFASHASWYLDEAIGIPVTNVHVVPVDPRSGAAIQTLWELVESAMVTVWSPLVMAGYDDGAGADRFRDGRFVTGVIASSDANGMIYLLPD